ncbi:MAG TPA: hypothetical protein VK842_04990, partial [bacterium]|nr:hypothetical protein [bacterium]
DGVNFCNGTSASTITQSNFRNTGDDSMASWSTGGTNNADSFTWNTVQCTWRADAIAVYGGTNYTISNNLCTDTLDQAGIMVQYGFTPIAGFGGTNTLTNNQLLRCGGYFSGNYGAFNFWANSGAIGGTWNITSMDSESSTYEGIEFDGGNSINGVTYTNSVCNNSGTYGVQVGSGTSGGATFNSTNMNGSASGAFTNAGSMSLTRNSCNW